MKPIDPETVRELARAGAKLVERERQGQARAEIKREKQLERNHYHPKMSPSDYSKATNIPFTLLLKDYLQTPGLRRTWVNKTKLIDQSTLPFFGTKPVDQISAADVERWVAWRQTHDETHNNTVLLELRHISAVINHGIRHGLCTVNPTWRMRKPKLLNSPPKWLTCEQYAALWNVLPEKARNVIDVLVCTGLRISEAIGLTPASVRDGFIYVEGRKSEFAQWAAIPISENMYRFLEALPPSWNGQLFRWKAYPPMWKPNKPGYQKGIGFTYENMKTTLEKACATLKVPFCGIHVFRHTCASWLVQRGFSLYAVQCVLGHANPEQTQIYAHMMFHNWDRHAEVLPARTKALMLEPPGNRRGLL